MFSFSVIPYVACLYSFPTLIFLDSGRYVSLKTDARINEKLYQMSDCFFEGFWMEDVLMMTMMMVIAMAMVSVIVMMMVMTMAGADVISRAPAVTWARLPASLCHSGLIGSSCVPLDPFGPSGFLWICAGADVISKAPRSPNASATLHP